LPLARPRRSRTARHTATGPVSGRAPEFWRQRLRAAQHRYGQQAGDSKGPSDFSDQLGHATIQTVRASIIPDRSFLLSAGTVIPCTLQTAINSTQAGYVSCVVNHDVFSENGRVILLDKGTKVLGQYSGGITQGQARMFVLWTRALTPRGVAIDLGSPAADSLGRRRARRHRHAVLGTLWRCAHDVGAGRCLEHRGPGGRGPRHLYHAGPSTMGQTILQSTMNIRPILKKNQGTPPRSSSPRTSISGQSMMCSSGGRPCLAKARRSISTTPHRSRHSSPATM
jgi:type IV secretory pathway VirB10-like protein